MRSERSNVDAAVCNRLRFVGIMNWVRVGWIPIVCSMSLACTNAVGPSGTDAALRDSDSSDAVHSDTAYSSDAVLRDVSNRDAGIVRDGDDASIAPSDGGWINVTSNLAGTPSSCGTIPHVAVKPNENMLIIGVVTRGLFASTDSGASWSPLGTATGSAAFSSGLSEILFDPTDDRRWWLAGVRYGTPFETSDNGSTLQKLADFPQNDGIGVDLTDPNRNTILVGGHEQVQEVEYSADGGNTWTNIGLNLPPDSGDSSFPYVVNASTFLVGTSHNQIYRTTDRGAHWTVAVNGGGGAYPLKHSDGSLYWAARDTQGVVRSTDDGATWQVVTPPGVVYGMAPIELPDGRIAMRGPVGMLVSADQGANWVQVSPPVPDDYWWFHTIYNPHDRSFYTTRFACDSSNVVNADALRRYAWDYAQH